MGNPAIPIVPTSEAERAQNHAQPRTRAYSAEQFYGDHLPLKQLQKRSHQNGRNDQCGGIELGN